MGQILTGASEVLRIVTDAAIAVDVVAHFIDKNGTTFTPDSTPTAITTATTTTIVAAPGASIQRNVLACSIRNKSTTTSVGVTVQFFDGTAYEITKEILAAGAELFYEDKVGWTVTANSPAVTHQIIAVAGGGTYNTPAGVRAIRVECVGGCGAGGSAATAATNSGAAGGGGGGAYAEAIIANPASSYAYVVGAGGTPGAAGANNGGAGGDTTFNVTTVVAKGGSGGLADTVTTIHVGGNGGAGGLASTSTGDLKRDGQPGGAGLALAAAQAVSGQGGGTVYGGGAASVKNATAGGTAGTAGGGSGACIISGGASQAGGAGAPGLIIVTEYR